MIDAIYDQHDRLTEAFAVREGRLLNTIENSLQLVRFVPPWQRPDLQHTVEEVPESNVLVETEVDGGREAVWEALALLCRYVDGRAVVAAAVSPPQITDGLNDRTTLAATHDARDRVVTIRKGRTQYRSEASFDVGAWEIGRLVVVLLKWREDVSFGVRLDHARVALVVRVGYVAATADHCH